MISDLVREHILFSRNEWIIVVAHLSSEQIQHILMRCGHIYYNILKMVHIMVRYGCASAVWFTQCKQ